MLKRTYRLTAKGDFARLFSKGRPTHGRYFVLKAVENRLGRTRVGFVVSTKVSKRAVVRNRIKRRMREAVRHIMPKIKPGHDITFVAKAISQDADFALLASDVTQALFKARLLV